MEEISLPAEEVAEFGSVVITNSFMATVLTSLILVIFAIFLRFKISLIPGRLQTIFEMIFEFFLNQLELALGDAKLARKLLPVFLTIFLLVLVANQFFLLPLVGAVVTDGHHVFRVPTSDYSLTIAMAAFLVVLSHIVAFAIAPINHINNFFRFRSFLKIKKLSDVPNAFIDAFLGILELIGEFARIISLATRLFGNIFSGEVIIIIVSGLMFYTQFLVPIPFYLLGILAGLVQAFVFTTLSLLFLSGTVRNAVHPH